jgi:hypothetical protein
MNRRLAVVLALALGLLLGFAAASLRPGPPPPPPPPPIPTLVPPLHDAKVGEWLKVEAGVDSQMFRVVGVSPDDYELTVEMIQSSNGVPVGGPEFFKWRRNSWSLPSDCVVRAIDRDRVEVGGKHYDCWRLAVFSHQRNMVYWISDEIPVHGVLKFTAVGKHGPDDAHAARAADWGFAPK